MNIQDNILLNSEKIVFTLRKLYSDFGYQPYRMSKFEEYDIYANNKDFLVSDNVITFTDTDGKLLALKPDVTLSIIKNSHDLPNETQKIYYNENVYRVSKGTNSFQEIMQVGLECFGRVTKKEIVEVISLAYDSLSMLSKQFVLELSDISILENIVSKMNLSSENTKKLYKAISEKNIPEVMLISSYSDQPISVEKLQKLLSLSGSPKSIIDNFDTIVDGEVGNSFKGTLQLLIDAGLEKHIVVDFSLVDDINYYNGIVFKGFIQGVPTAVLSGGQYNKLMAKLKYKSEAIGFAVYMDTLERFEMNENSKNESDEYINVALPKGRLGEKVYNLFASIGYDCDELLESNRKLVFENPIKKVRYFWVKPSDVSIYVERGAADIGVVGKDILLEYSPDVYELLDMNTGKCNVCVAAPKGFKDDVSKTLRVATKFSNIAKKYYTSIGRDIDIVHLNGSIEIAPLLDLTDVIVDIVETGSTLKENNLEVIEKIVPISARFIANKSSYKFKQKQITSIVSDFTKMLEESN